MDRNVRQMLKLIEENGDSFAQKAEMYYQKRPELISLVEEFHRGYRSLAERYDHVTNELSKNNNNTPHDLQSQASDNGSEAPFASPGKSFSGRRIPTNRAAGFDFFLGSSGNLNGFDQKDGIIGDGSSSTLTFSDDEYDDDSSVNSFSGFYGNGINDMNKRVLELEIELREVKEKLYNMHEEDGSSLSKGARVENNVYDEELMNVNEKLRLCEGEVSKLKIELGSCRSSKRVKELKDGVEVNSNSIEDEMRNLDLKKLEEELRVTKGKLESSERRNVSLEFGAIKSSESIQQLQDQLGVSEKDIAAWKEKFNTQKRENSKLQERVSRMRTNLAERDHEVRELKAALSDAEQKNFFERAHLKSEISKLLVHDKLKGCECQCQSLKDKMRKIQSEKMDMRETLGGEIEMLKEEIEDKRNNMKELNVRLDGLRLKRDSLYAEVGSLKDVIRSKDGEIEEAHKQVEELESRMKQLEEEIERQRVEILEGAEGKREAIRQLCSSIEHFRVGYNLLRKAFIVHEGSCFGHLIYQHGCKHL
ncbi:hypothetical protein RJT34_12971 [Clitoria ternatea]|uniref:NAB domain-containing protein n=1 Tax=Clitoria ternatea TaxID=43366 RepID=A0AAN9JQT0_CLITE